MSEFPQPRETGFDHAADVERVRGLLYPGYHQDLKWNAALMEGIRGKRDIVEEAVRNGVFLERRTYPHSIQSYVGLNEHGRRIVSDIARRAGAERAASFLRRPEMLSSIDLAGPDRERFLFLVERVSGIERFWAESPDNRTPEMLERCYEVVSEFPVPVGEAVLREVMEYPDPVVWTRARKRAIGPAWEIIRSEFDYGLDQKFVHFSNRLLGLIRSQSWPTHVNRYVIERYGGTYGRDDKVNTSAIKEKVGLLMKLFSAEHFSSEAPEHVRSLMGARPMFLRALREAVSDEAWGRILEDAQTAGQITKIEEVSELMAWASARRQKAWKAREAIAYRVEPGAEGYAEELVDLLRTSGVEPLARLVAKRVVLFPPEQGSRAFFEHFGAEIRLYPSQAQRSLMLSLAAHEIGHGIQGVLPAMRGGQDLYDRYAVATIVEPINHSSYAESYRLRGDEYNFVSESFAEDVRLLLFAPDKVPERKRAALRAIVERVSPGFDVEEVSRRIRSVQGSYYGTNVEDLLRWISCETPQEVARAMEEGERQEELARQEARDESGAV